MTNGSNMRKLSQGSRKRKSNAKCSNARLFGFLLLVAIAIFATQIMVANQILFQHPPADSMMNNYFAQPKPPQNPIEYMLERSGANITDKDAANLPSWSEIVQIYGAEPIIAGLETCQTFRDTVPNEKASIAPAGLFNTGTNYMAKLLQLNCYMPDRVTKFGVNETGMRYQVPWGKHRPVSTRLHHVAYQHEGIEFSSGKGVVQTDVLPIVMIKDPYLWMMSMCNHPYTVYWPRNKINCPNLKHSLMKVNQPKQQNFNGKEKAHDAKQRQVMNDQIGKMLNGRIFKGQPKQQHGKEMHQNKRRLQSQPKGKLIKHQPGKHHKRQPGKEKPKAKRNENYPSLKEVRGILRQNRNRLTVIYDKQQYTYHSSLVHLWNDFYLPWYNATFPHLLVRYEDLLFHPEEIVKQVCKCGGGKMRETFHHSFGSAKTEQGLSSGVTEALMKFGNASKQVKQFTESDLSIAKKELNLTLLERFDYKLPSR